MYFALCIYVCLRVQIGVNEGVVGLAVDDVPYGIRNLRCVPDDCGAATSSCISHVGQRQEDPQGKIFALLGCISRAIIYNVADVAAFDGAYVDLLDSTTATFNASGPPELPADTDATCFGPTALGFPVASSGVQSVNAGRGFAVVLMARVTSQGSGYLFSKSGPGALRYYSLYASRVSSSLVFYFTLEVPCAVFGLSCMPSAQWGQNGPRGVDA